MKSIRCFTLRCFTLVAAGLLSACGPGGGIGYSTQLISSHSVNRKGTPPAEEETFTTRTDAITIYDTTGRLLAGLGTGTTRQHLGGGLVLERRTRGTPVPGKLTTLTLFRAPQLLGLDVRAGLWSGPVFDRAFDLGVTLGVTLYAVLPKGDAGGTWIGLPISLEASREVVPMLRLGLRGEWDPLSLATMSLDYAIGLRAIFVPFRWFNLFADAQHYRHPYLTVDGKWSGLAGTLGVALLWP